MRCIGLRCSDNFGAGQIRLHERQHCDDRQHNGHNDSPGWRRTSGRVLTARCFYRAAGEFGELGIGGRCGLVDGTRQFRARGPYYRQGHCEVPKAIDFARLADEGALR